MLLKEYEISIWEDYQIHEYELWEERENNEVVLLKTIQVMAGEELESIPNVTYKPTNQWFEERKLAVIGSNTMDSECRACTPEFKKNVNGEYSLTFILYSRYFDHDKLEYTDNPFIKLLVNERKLKLKYKNKWYDFIIKSIDENSDTKSYTYTATALFINELAKNGLDLVFDPEQENSTGDIISLGSVVVEGTDWKISEQSELIQQTNIEPLYELVLITDIQGHNMFGTDVIDIPMGQTIYGFYSSIINESPYFQFLYREDGNYEINTETGAITNSVNWYIDNVTYNNSIPEFCSSIDKVSEVYRGERYVRNIVTQYDPRVDKFVTVYEDELGEKVLGYTENEYLAPDLVLNLITNPNDFTDTSGWEKEGTEYLYTDFYPSIDKLTGAQLMEALKNASLTMQTTLQSGERILNTGLRDNRKTFLKNGIALDEEYILHLNFKVNSNTGISSSLNGFVAFYDGMTEDGKYNIEKIEGKERHIFDFTSLNDITGTLEGITRRAKAQYAVTYQEMLRKKLGFFLENSSNAAADYIFIEVQLFKYFENDGILLTPSTTPTGIIKTFYYYYYDKINKDAVSIEDIEFSYQGQLPVNSDTYKAVYDNNCTKKRTLKISKSNRFNIIQELCELFECWADFIVEHNEDGSIKRDEEHQPIKYIIFKKYIGKDNFAGFKYGINSKSIQRVVDSEQIVSKILVEENNNEFAIDGACSIARAKDNPTGELFFYDFRHYYTHGLLNYSELINDLYTVNDDLPWLGYYTRMKRANKERQILLDELSALSISLTNLEALTQTYYLIYTEASEDLNSKKKEFANYPVTQGITYESYENSDGISDELYNIINKDPEALSIITSIEVLKKKYNTYKDAYENHKEAYDAATLRYNEIEDILNNIKEQKELLNEKFYNKYSRFIQEGSWQSQDYLDDDLFYYDAAATLAQSASPQISYNINIVDVSTLEDFQGYEFDTGDKTTIEDTEFFGWTIINGAKTPIQEEIIVSEIITILDSPQENIIKVQNYKTKFEDMFQRISSVTTSLQYQSGGFAQAAAIVTNTGEIKAETLQQSFANNSFALSNAADQNVLWDEQGITITSPKSPNQMVRLINGGVYLTADGGSTWSAAVTGRGINATYINSGQIDTNLIRIMNGVWPTYRWDTNGISAYSYVTNDEGSIITINYDKFVRFNQYGIFGAVASENWIPTSVQDVKDVADFALTWDGFLLRNKYDKGYLELSSLNDFIVHDGTNERIKIGNIGSSKEPIYGISIKDGNGTRVMESNDDGTLWLKDKLNISTSQDISSHVQVGYLEQVKADTNIHEVINATDKFIVYEDGSIIGKDVYFENGYFEGEINATSGKIGNLTIEDVSQGIASNKYRVEIVSSNGVFFKNNQGETQLECKVYSNNIEINENIAYQWYKGKDIIENATTKFLTVTAAEVDSIQTYSCEVNI